MMAPAGVEFLCDDISLFGNCFTIIGLFVRLAVSVLIRDSGVITFNKSVFLLRHLV